MYCKKCLYNLSAIRDSTCPECGRAFDPDTPSTYLASPGARFGKLNWMTAILASTPMMLPIMVTVTWFFSWMALGHRPVPSIDDPKGIDSSLVQACYFITMVLIMAIPPALLLVFGMLLASGTRCFLDRHRLRGFFILLVYSIMNLVMAYSIVKTMPQDIFNWLID